MTKFLASAAVAVIAAAAFGTAHAGTTFVSGTAVSNASAVTDAEQSSYGQGFGTKTTTTSSLKPKLSANTQANAVSDADDGFDADSANALEQANGYFASSAAGTLDLAGITSASTYAPGETAEAYSEGQSLQYTFAVSSASVINLDYALSESYTGCCATTQLYLGAADFSSQVYNNDLALDTSGVLSFNLSPGTYLLSLASQIGDNAYAENGASAFGDHEEKLDFNISAAPEPGGWGLLVAAVALGGVALRRRSRLALI